MGYPDFSTYISNIAVKPVNIVVDLILLCIALTFVIKGARRGFVVSAINFARPLASVFIAWFACEAVGVFLCDAGFFSGMTEMLMNGLRDAITDPEFQAEHAGETVTGFTGIIGALLALSGNEQLAKDLSGFISGDETLLMEIALSITSVVATIVSFVLLLILANILIRILASVLGKIFELPGLNVLNTLLGIAFGALCGLIVCWGMSYVLYFLCTWLGTSVGIDFFQGFGTGEGTYIEQAFFNFNPIQWAIEALSDSLVFAETPTV